MPSTYGELELPCLRSNQIHTTLVIKLKYIKNLIKRCKKSQNKKKQLSTVYLAKLVSTSRSHTLKEHISCCYCLSKN